MDKTIIKFGDNEIDKHKFHQYERPISIRYLDFNQIVVCKKVSIGKKGFKYFISYKFGNKLKTV